MTNNKAKDQAERLRKAYIGQLPDSEIERVADELDPPKSKPGSVVLWQFDGSSEWDFGIAGTNGIAIENGYELPWDTPDLRWRPARMLGSRQVAVDVLPVSEWGDGWTALRIETCPLEADGFSHGRIDDVEITRNQAERMEERDDDSTKRS